MIAETRHHFGEIRRVEGVAIDQEGHSQFVIDEEGHVALRTLVIEWEGAAGGDALTSDGLALAGRGAGAGTRRTSAVPCCGVSPPPGLSV